MISNMNFYDFMHKQILVLIGLFTVTGLGYIYIGFLYGYLVAEIIWYCVNIIISFWGYSLYKKYKYENLTLEEKEKWLHQLKYFLFTYFLLWTVIFLIYVSKSDVELHYIALATQFGCGVVSATVLVSQRKLASITLFSIMFPIFIYFLLVNEFYSYLLAFFTFVVSWVLHYASSNTYDYLVKSQFQAYHDYLTSLGNRRFFTEVLEDSLGLQKDNKKSMFLLLIDLDYFKVINDTLGHDIGDKMLIEVSRRMQKLSDEHKYTLARLGGDEFCILSPFCKDLNTCQNTAPEFANRLLEIIKEPYYINSHQLFISASIGVTIIESDHEVDATSVIKEADIAMYEAKNHGRNGVIVFSLDMMDKIQRKFEIERHMHFAVEENEIKLCFQPQKNLETNKYSVEVLARWKNKELGDISPDIFIPIAEGSGKIIDLGLHILEESILALKRWHMKKIEVEQISINISVKQILHKDFINEVERLIYTHLDAKLCNKLMFEITETSAADDVNLVAQNIRQLKPYGIKFSMDDFGTGYSSINYLRELNVDELKIDKVFVQEIEKGIDEQNIIRTILNISKSLNIKVIAEGVETKEQYDFLKAEKCHLIQGNFISKPLDEEKFLDFIKHS